MNSSPAAVDTEFTRNFNDKSSPPPAAHAGIAPDSDHHASPSSWRSILPIHPAAELFPLISPDELRALGENIRARGLISPIAITASRTETGWSYQLLDGRNRLDAMEAVGIPARLELLKGQCTVFMHADLDHDYSVANVIESDPYAYVISANIARRHLSGEQKRELVEKLLKTQPERSNNATAKLAKVDDKTVASVRRELESTSEIPKLGKTVGADGKARPAKHRPMTTKSAKPKPSDAGATLKPSHERAARKLLNLFCEMPVEVQKHFLEVMRDDIGPDHDGNDGDELESSGCQEHADQQNEAREKPVDLMAILDNFTATDFLAVMPVSWRPMLEARVCHHLSATQLVDLLESRLRRDGIHATAALQKIQKLIDRPKTIDLKTLPAADAA